MALWRDDPPPGDGGLQRRPVWERHLVREQLIEHHAVAEDVRLDRVPRALHKDLRGHPPQVSRLERELELAAKMVVVVAGRDVVVQMLAR